jgi:hypothetical protein
MNTALLTPPTTEPDVLPYTTSVLEQPWWLDAVAPGHWRAATVCKGGELFARLPYRRVRRYGLTAVSNPPLCHHLGPWFRPWTGKYAGELGRQKELILDLVLQLPEADLVSLTLTPLLSNALPFCWSGFRHTTRYTYRIEDLTDLDRVWAEFTNERRNVIRRAQKIVQVRDDLPVDTLYALLTKTWARQGRRPHVSLDLVRRVHAAARAHNACKLLFAEDADGSVHAAVFVVFDERVAYYLLGGADPGFHPSGAYSLLVWEALQAAASSSRVFDFAGSSARDIEHFNRTFGARQRREIHVTRRSRRLALLVSARSVGELLLGRHPSVLE